MHKTLGLNPALKKKKGKRHYQENKKVSHTLGKMCLQNTCPTELLIKNIEKM
jgi:hypothetical protein